MTSPQQMRFPSLGDFALDAAGRLMMFAWVRVRAIRGLPPLSFTFPQISRATWGAWCVRARICLL